jgi:beta-galactosidase
MTFRNLVQKSFMLCLLWVSSFVINAQTRTITTLQTHWKFSKGNPVNAASLGFNDSDWETVKVPHDWAIGENFKVDGDGNTGKLPWKGEGWYRKELEISTIEKGKKLQLIFDGVMAFPQVFINGKLAGKWDYGYNSFHVDITSFVNYGGKNVLAVYADTRKHDSRWYPGAGIYRKVQLLVTNPIHVNIWGTYITTPTVKEHLAEVRINTSINNETNQKSVIKVEQIIYSSLGKEVVKKEVKDTLLPNKSKDFEATLKIINPVFWDVKNPNLYSVITNVFKDNKLVDSEKSIFGVRTIHFTADDGFYLNNRRVQLKGVNLHSDLGPLGMAFNYRAMERELEIMKSMGVNAIRNSHNVAAPELLALCDQMGLLFFNEIFDKYDGKANITAATDFDEFAHRNIKNFVTRDRNHPSVFIWSVGNEIGDVQWNINSGFKRLHTMVNYVNKYDPTRPTTLVCDQLKSAALRHFDYYDVHSWNYGRRYRLARQIEPNKSVIISESASTLSTRGFYEFPLPKEKTAFTKSLQVSSYDLNAPWWAEISDDDFMWQQDENYIAGEFVWTGFDYLGEPTPYDNSSVKKLGFTNKQASRSSYFGAVDLVGIPKDRYYLYKSHWKKDENMVHVLPHWNWKGKEGDTIPVFAYTNGDSGELFVNGKSQGIQYKKPSSKNSIERFRLMWNEVLYKPGEIKVVAYKKGEIIAEKSIKTAKKPYRLKLSADRKTIKANGKDLSYVLVEAFDKDGNFCPLADFKIDLKIKGNATIAGVGNGNPQSFEPFQSNKVTLFYGKAMVILSSEFKKGTVKLTAKAGAIKEDFVIINIE